MRYVVLVSHGRLACGLHSALDMLAGEGREDILSAGLENGMGADTYERWGRRMKSCCSAIW